MSRPQAPGCLIVTVCALLAVFVFAWLPNNFPSFPLFEGDGKFRDNGPFRIVGYEYEIRLDEFTVEEESVTVVRKFSGASSEEYLFQVYVKPPSRFSNNGNPPLHREFLQFDEMLSSQQVQISVKILQDGNEYIVVTPSNEEWIRSTWSYYHIDLDDIQISKQSSYELYITVTFPTKLSEPVTFRPVLWGGYLNVF